ncbi:MAG: hypothetical protein ACLFR1_01485 [Spirochaetia bacterium]
MKKDDFSIGTEFTCGDKIWRCTDIGTRTITAVCLSDHLDDPSWYNGPPYAVAETVFDEYDLPECKKREEHPIIRIPPDRLKQHFPEITSASLFRFGETWPCCRFTDIELRKLLGFFNSVQKKNRIAKALPSWVIRFMTEEGQLLYRITADGAILMDVEASRVQRAYIPKKKGLVEILTNAAQS